MGHQRQRKSDAKYAQKRRREVAERDELQNVESHDVFALSPNGILNLQNTIGNQAVQRLIVQRDPVNQEVIEADSRNKGGTRPLPSVVATITGANQGKFNGGSKIAGHEGKVEILGISLEPSKDKMTVTLTKQVDESSPAFSKAMLRGEPLTTAQFDGIRRNDKGDVEIVKSFEFSDGVVTSLQYSESEGVPLEIITIEFVVKPEEKKSESE